MKSCMAPYSVDLRDKILQACERELAELIGVGISLIEKLLMRVRSAGQVEPTSQAQAFTDRCHSAITTAAMADRSA